MRQDHLRPCAVFTETSEGVAPYYLAEIRHDLSQTTGWLCLRCGARLAATPISTAVVEVPKAAVNDWYC